jgi:hypothetical protein
MQNNIPTLYILEIGSSMINNKSARKRLFFSVLYKNIFLFCTKNNDHFAMANMTRATRVSAQCMLAQLRILYVEAMFKKCG